MPLIGRLRLLAQVWGLTLALCLPAWSGAVPGRAAPARLKVAWSPSGVARVPLLPAKVSRAPAGMTPLIAPADFPTPSPVPSLALELPQLGPVLIIPETSEFLGQAQPRTILKRLSERSSTLAKPGVRPEGELDGLYVGQTADLDSPVRPSRTLMKEQSRLEEALASRDLKLTNSLLRAARKLDEYVPTDQRAAAGEISLAIFTGRYKEAGEKLKAISSADVDTENWMRFKRVLRSLDAALPKSDLLLEEVLSSAAREVLSSVSGNPFEVQEMLFTLLSGLGPRTIPRPLETFSDSLAKKASWLARERGLARQGADTGPVQKHGDCRVRAIYDLPLPALDALRKSLPYEKFLGKVSSLFPFRDVKKNGLTDDDFRGLMGMMGLRTVHHRTNQKGLEELLTKHGALIASMGWFDKNASEQGAEAWLNYRSHSAIISGMTGPRDAREFIVRDSEISHETRYTMAELGLMRFTAYSISVASPEKLQEFSAD